MPGTGRFRDGVLNTLSENRGGMIFLEAPRYIPKKVAFNSVFVTFIYDHFSAVISILEIAE